MVGSISTYHQLAIIWLDLSSHIINCQLHVYGWINLHVSSVGNYHSMHRYYIIFMMKIYLLVTTVGYSAYQASYQKFLSPKGVLSMENAIVCRGDSFSEFC